MTHARKETTWLLTICVIYSFSGFFSMGWNPETVWFCNSQKKRNSYQSSFLRFGLQAKRKGKVESGTHGDEYSNEVNPIRNCPNFRTCNFPQFHCSQKNAFLVFQKIFFCYVQEKRGCYVSAIPWYNAIACLVVECMMVARSMRLYS